MTDESRKKDKELIRRGATKKAASRIQDQFRDRLYFKEIIAAIDALPAVQPEQGLDWKARAWDAILKNRDWKWRIKEYFETLGEPFPEDGGMSCTEALSRPKLRDILGARYTPGEKEREK